MPRRGSTRQLRDELAQFVVAIAEFRGFGPNGGGSMAVPKGTRLRTGNQIVVKYGDKFRALTEPEIERIVASWRRRWKAGAGL
jgi:hypothetical protein